MKADLPEIHGEDRILAFLDQQKISIGDNLHQNTNSRNFGEPTTTDILGKAEAKSRPGSLFKLG